MSMLITDKFLHLNTNIDKDMNYIYQKPLKLHGNLLDMN
jgi:hypothetical protein